MQEQVSIEASELRNENGNSFVIFSGGAVIVVMLGLLIFRALHPRSR